MQRTKYVTAKPPGRVRILLLAIALAAVLAGCLSTDDLRDPPGRLAETAIVDHSAAMEVCRSHNGQYGRCIESSVAIDGLGRMYVANGFGTEIAVSANNGETWEHLEGPALPQHAAFTVIDTDALIRATPDGKAVYSAIFAQYPEGLLLGLHVAVSSDGGRTWPVNRLISMDDRHQTVGADRQWTAMAPDGALYIAYDHLFADPVAFGSPVPLPVPTNGYEVLGNPLEVARSDDGGETWGPFVEATPPGVGSYGGDIVANADGELVMTAVNGPPDMSTVTLNLLRSKDRGVTWSVDAVTEPESAETGPGGWPSYVKLDDGSEVVGWQRADNSLWVSVRPAGATSWGSPVRWSLEGETVSVGPVLAASPGGFALSYAAETGQEPDRLGAFILVQGDANGPKDRLVLVENVPLDERLANSDFATLAAAPDGRLAVSVTRTDPQGIDVYIITPGPLRRV